MQITDELLDRIAKLAKLEIRPEEREKMKADFQKMLDFVDQLQEVDTTGVEPLIHMTGAVNNLRADEPQPPLDRTEMLERAPQHDKQYFKVPKILDK